MGRNSKVSLYFCAALLVLAAASRARASIFDADSFATLTALQSGPLPTELVKTVGVATDLRPFRGATPLADRGAGIDFGIDFVLVILPPGLGPALTDAGFSAGSSLPPSLPIPRLSLQKGMGPADLGVSFIGYSGYLMAGGWIQFPITEVDQGPRISARAGYEYSVFSMVSTHTITPAIVVSREMDFFEPYLVFGWNYVWGKLTFPITVGPVTIEYESKARANGVFGQLGTVFRLGPTGLQLALEGGYHQLGMHCLGFKFGFRF